MDSLAAVRKPAISRSEIGHFGVGHVMYLVHVDAPETDDVSHIANSLQHSFSHRMSASGTAVCRDTISAALLDAGRFVSTRPYAPSTTWTVSSSSV